MMQPVSIERGVRMLPIGDIRLAGINPDTRSNLPKGFLDSIKKHGVLTPVIVNEDNVLVDGHRRRQACIEHGIDSVPAITMAGDPIVLFCAFNEHTRPISGSQWAQVRMKGGAIPGLHEKNHAALAKIFTAEEMRELYTLRPYSFAIINDARFIARYLGENTPDKQRQIIRWILTHGVQIKMVRDAIKNRTPAEVIDEAIENGKPIRMSVRVDSVE